MVFTAIGSAGDYGFFDKWLLLVMTVICWAAQFASMTLTCKWPCLECYSWARTLKGHDE